jgi:Fe-S cluster assembly protein SufD
MNEPARTPFVAALADAPLPASGIGWLDQARRENLDAFATAGLPDTRVEAWKYTALRALAQRSFAVGDAQAAQRTIDPSMLALAGIDGPVAVFVNGVFRAELSVLDALPAGVSLQPLSQVLQGEAEPLRFALSRHYREPGDAFARLNAAFAGDGVVLRVAAGATVALPLRLLFIGAAAAGDLAWHVRHLVELGEGAELCLIEQHLGQGEQSHLGTQVADLALQAGATLHHVLLQQAGTGSSLIRRSHYRLDARAQAHLHALELGGGLARHDLRAELVGDGAGFHTHGAFLPQGRQHIDTQLAIHHRARDTASTSTWRGVASDRGRGVFRGAIVVAAGADGSDATLNNKNLLLSTQAEIDTKPELEIYADEVKAAHGATVGQLDERALFYLRSRGIPGAQARALLTTAFARAPFESLPHAALREHVDQLLLAQLPG